MYSTRLGRVGMIGPDMRNVSPVSSTAPGRTAIGIMNMSTSRPWVVNNGPPFGPPAAPWYGGNNREPSGSSASV